MGKDDMLPTFEYLLKYFNESFYILFSIGISVMRTELAIEDGLSSSKSSYRGTKSFFLRSSMFMIALGVGVATFTLIGEVCAEMVSPPTISA